MEVQNSRPIQEFKRSDLGDRRLNKRLSYIAEALIARPDAGLPEVFPSSAELEGTYRFLSNPKVNAKAILAPHVTGTLARARVEKEVLILHDTTTFVFRGECEREGLDWLSSHKQGFCGHFALCVGLDSETPLGILGIHTFSKSQKDKDKWWGLIQDVDAPDTKRLNAIHVMDREADSYDLFSNLAEHNKRYVVRLYNDRKLKGPARLFDHMKTLPVITERVVPISSRPVQNGLSSQKAYPARDGRLATLEFSAGKVCIRRPQNADAQIASLDINIVYVSEKDAPEDAQPVEWKLATTESIETEQDILRVVDIYRKRWTIEEFFKALKTGCAMEKRQLESKKTLLNALAIFTPIAWNLLLLRSMQRSNAKALASTLLSATQIEVLRRFSKRHLPPKPSIAQAMLAIAGLGGHITNNGDPGWQVLGRGYERMLVMESAWEAALQTCDQS